MINYEIEEGQIEKDYYVSFMIENVEYGCVATICFNYGGQPGLIHEEINWDDKEPPNSEEHEKAIWNAIARWATASEKANGSLLFKNPI